MADVSRRTLLATSAAGATLAAMPHGVLAAAPARRAGDMPFDTDWRFHLGDAPGAERPGFADAGWRTVELPHDWSLEDRPDAPRETSWVPPVALASPAPRPKDAPKLIPGLPITVPMVLPASADGPPARIGPFDPAASAGGWATGWVVGGVGWYRKRFALADLPPGEQAQLIFDGAFSAAEVWVNGAPAARNVNGWLPFAVDLTSHLVAGGANVVAVRVANEGNTSRWYSGSGLYRHVRLRRTGAVRIPDDGVTVRTAAVTAAQATLDVGVEVANRGAAAQAVECRVAIRDAAGRIVGTATRSLSVAPGAPAALALQVTVPRPALWSPETPNLHHAEVTLLVGGRTSDTLSPRFGIRTLAVSAAKGLEINGRAYKLRGACVHHDNGLLGAVAIGRADRRKVELLKANGFNAIRCSHNAHSPAFMDACDELGMIVMGELFDVWEQKKFSEQGYQTLFTQHWRPDTTTWIRRDRNHPSIAMWSLGNEIPEIASARGGEIATQMRALILSLDPTRLVTAALTSAAMGKGGEAARRPLDVAGYNYGLPKAVEDHAAQPAAVFVLTETLADTAWDNWAQADVSPWLLGEFLWTGMDYLGEVGCGSSVLVDEGTKPNPAMSFMGLDMSQLFVWNYPAYQSGCGDIDILGLKKPASHYRDVLWRRSPIEMFVQRPLPPGKMEALSGWGWHDELASWTWPRHEGATVTVRVYTRGDTVALLLDGREVGRKALAPGDKLKAEFPVRYAPGTLVAVAYVGGAEIGRTTLSTVGAPARLGLRAEAARIGAGPGDLGYVFAEVLDAQGRLVPDAAVPIEFAVGGAARLLRAGSANPYGIESFQDARTRTFHGTAQAIVRPIGRRGDAIVRVTGGALAPAALRLPIG